MTYCLVHQLIVKFRSSDPELLNILEPFYERTPVVLDYILNFINTRLTSDYNLDQPYVFAKRWQCGNFNNNRVSQIGSRVYVFQYFNVTNTRVPMSTYPLASAGIKRQFRYLPELRICVNSKVMLLNNLDIPIGLVNGSFGTVREIDDVNHQIKVEFASTEGPLLITLRPTKEIVEEWYLYQFPIVPAYATTVHKTQGILYLLRIDAGKYSHWGH